MKNSNWNWKCIVSRISSVSSILSGSTNMKQASISSTYSTRTYGTDKYIKQVSNVKFRLFFKLKACKKIFLMPHGFMIISLVDLSLHALIYIRKYMCIQECHLHVNRGSVCHFIYIYMSMHTEAKGNWLVQRCCLYQHKPT